MNKEFLEKIKPDGSKSPTIDVNWTNQYRPSTAGRKRAKNIPGDPCGVPLGAAKDAKTPAEAWSLFFDAKYMELLVTRTNASIQEKLDEIGPLENISSKQRSFLYLTDEIELRPLFGLLYYRALFGMTKQKASRLFDKRIGHPVFSATMSRNRFTFLHGQLRFDDKSTRKTRHCMILQIEIENSTT